MEAYGKKNAVFSVDIELHNDFKQTCASKGINMSIVIEKAMGSFIRRIKNPKTTATFKPSTTETPKT